jgi:hypothetical protein
MLPCRLCLLKKYLGSQILLASFDVMSMALPSQKAEGSYDLCTPGITDSLHVQMLFYMRFEISLIVRKCISGVQISLINFRIDRCHSVCWILHKWGILVSWCKVTHCEAFAFYIHQSCLWWIFYFEHHSCLCLYMSCHRTALCTYISLQAYIYNWDTGELLKWNHGILASSIFWSDTVELWDRHEMCPPNIELQRGCDGVGVSRSNRIRGSIIVIAPCGDWWVGQNASACLWGTRVSSCFPPAISSLPSRVSLHLKAPPYLLYQLWTIMHPRCFLWFVLTTSPHFFFHCKIMLFSH